MATLLGNPEIKDAISSNGFIKNGNQDNIDGLKYDFSLSSRILKAKFKQPIDISALPETRKVDLVIEPGEVVFVLTQEVLMLPNDIMALLIPKRKLSHDGIMILGGLSVDPLYEGRLLIGLYNLSSSAYPIIPGRKLIAAQFYRLSESEKIDISKPQVRITDFPDDLIRLMQSYKPVSSEALMNSVSTLESKFDNLLQEFRSKDDWFNKLQDSMDKQEKTVDKILEGLEKEVTDRRTSDQEVERKVEGMRGEIKEYLKSSYKTAAIIGVVGALVMSALFKWVLEPKQAPPVPQQIFISMDSIKKAAKDTSKLGH
jgi:deoxycytidine triphosphate deaminase